MFSTWFILSTERLQLLLQLPLFSLKLRCAGPEFVDFSPEMSVLCCYPGRPGHHSEEKRREPKLHSGGPSVERRRQKRSQPLCFLIDSGIFSGNLIKKRFRKFNPLPSFGRDRKSTRLNSSHQIISYAVFCLKKKNRKKTRQSCYDPHAQRNCPNRHQLRTERLLARKCQQRPRHVMMRCDIMCNLEQRLSTL